MQAPCYAGSVRDDAGRPGVFVEVPGYGSRERAEIRIQDDAGRVMGTYFDKDQLRALIHSLQAAFAMLSDA